MKSIPEKDFYLADDGFWYYWPDNGHGAFSEAYLRRIADELSKRNCEWEKKVAGEMNKMRLRESV